jgi:hypothetical protein
MGIAETTIIASIFHFMEAFLYKSIYKPFIIVPCLSTLLIIFTDLLIEINKIQGAHSIVYKGRISYKEYFCIPTQTVAVAAELCLQNHPCCDSIER